MDFNYLKKIVIWIFSNLIVLLLSYFIIFKMERSHYLFKYIETTLFFLFSFLYTIILSRLSGPEVLGYFTVVSGIILFLETIINTSFSSSHIQHEDNTLNTFLNSLFYNIFLGLVIFITLFFLTFILKINFFNVDLTVPLRILSFKVLLSSFNSIISSYMQKANKYLYHCLFIISSLILSIILSFLLLAHITPFYSLIIQSISYSLFLSFLNFLFILNYFLKLNFKILKFSFNLRILFTGLSLGISSFLDSFFILVKKVILGIQFSPEILAFSQKGSQISELLISFSISALNPIHRSEISNYYKTNLLSKILERSRLYINYTTFFIYPLLFGLIGINNELILTIYGPEWNQASFYLTIFCLSSLTWPTQIFMQNSLKLFKNGKIYLIIEVSRKIISFLFLLFAFFLDVELFFISFLSLELLSQVIVSVIFSKIFSFSIFYQVKDIFPSLLSSFIMYLFISQIIFNTILLTLIIKILFGFFIYLGLSFFCNKKLFISFLKLIKIII